MVFPKIYLVFFYDLIRRGIEINELNAARISICISMVSGARMLLLGVNKASI
jgi:hypothetical protein